MLYLELKTGLLPLLKGNEKRHKQYAKTSYLQITLPKCLSSCATFM